MSELVESLDRVHEQLLEEEGIKASALPDGIKRKIKGWNLLLARLKKSPDDQKLFRSLQKSSVEIADKIQDFIENDYESEEEAKEREAKEREEAEAKKKEEEEAKKKAEAEKKEEDGEGEEEEEEEEGEEEEEEGDGDGEGDAEAKKKAEAEAKKKEEEEAKKKAEAEKKEEDGDGEGEGDKKTPPKPKGGFGNLVMEKKILAKIKEYDPADGRIRESDLEKIIGKEPDYPEQKVHTITLRKVFLSSEYRLKK